MSLRNPKDLYCPQWWWSQEPFWKYEDSRKCGWGHFVDKHPGLFNLAWAVAGGPRPPADYSDHAHKVLWVIQEAEYIPMFGDKMADCAYYLSLPEFAGMLVHDAKRLKSWRFRTKGATYESILQAVQQTALACA